MMDPVTAIGLVAAVVQFTDFSARLLTDSLDVYKSASGMTSKVVEVATVRNDLEQLSLAIQAKSAHSKTSRENPSVSEQTLLRLCFTCQELSKELDNAIKKLRTRRSDTNQMKFNSFVVALRSYWSRDKINGFRDQLSEVRQQMMMAMLTFLWERSKVEANDAEQVSQQQADLLKTLNQVDDNTRFIYHTLNQLVQRQKSEKDWGFEEVVRSIWLPSWTSECGNLEGVEVDGEKSSESSCTMSIINSLAFEDIDNRGTAIPKAYETTFEWMFRIPRSAPDGSPLWSDFLSWLDSPSTEDIYWITGKPGSGKSTLMKFVTAHAALREHLDLWSATRPCLLACFYSWYAGSPLQKTQGGLLRSVLYQCLKQRPNLVSKVCPRRWALCQLFSKSALQGAPEWGLQELSESFSALTSLAGEDFNLALFIDGLDEFDGGHEELIEVVKSFRTHPGIKSCVSSRPWNVFADALSHGPSLKLQDLTELDITAYVRGKLDLTEGFQELIRTMPAKVNELVDNVIEKAQGVFLWITVVVRIIIQGLTEGDKLSEVQALVDQLSGDVSQLYDSIWSRIDPKHIAESSQLFQIHEASSMSLDVITMWLADQEDPFETDILGMTPERRISTSQYMKRRLNSRTRGLLEVTSSETVEYLHRTVFDWIKPIWSDICSKTNPEFDPNLSLAKATASCLSKFKLSITESSKFRHHEFNIKLHICFCFATNVRDYLPNVHNLCETLDRLDAICTDISVYNPHGDPVPPFYQGVSKDYYDWSQGHHWSAVVASEKEMLSRDKSKSSFLGLAARFSVLQYIRTKVMDHPHIVISRPVLFDAVWGDGLIKMMTTGLSFITNISTRCELIRFIMRTEAEFTKDNAMLESERVTKHLEIYRYRYLIESALKDIYGGRTPGRWIEYIDTVCEIFEQEHGFIRDNAAGGEAGAKADDSLRSVVAASRGKSLRRVLKAKREGVSRSIKQMLGRSKP